MEHFYNTGHLIYHLPEVVQSGRWKWFQRTGHHGIIIENESSISGSYWQTHLTGLAIIHQPPPDAVSKDLFLLELKNHSAHPECRYATPGTMLYFYIIILRHVSAFTADWGVPNAPWPVDQPQCMRVMMKTWITAC